MRATLLALLALLVFALPCTASVAVLLATAPDSSLQSFLDSDADTLIVQSKPGGWVSGPLWMRNSHRTLILQPGVEIRARAGAFPGRNDCLLTLGDVRNVTLLGYGARLVMNKSEYVEGEWRHALSIRGSRGIVVEGLGLDSSGGDGLYIDGWWKNKMRYSKDIVIRHCRIRGNKRQGISVISAENVLVEHCVVEGTQGAAPEAGIDFEPDAQDHRLYRVKVRNSVFRNNSGSPALLYLHKFSRTTKPVMLEFEDCLFERAPWGRPTRIAAFPEGMRGEAVFRRSRFQARNGVALSFDKKPRNSAVVRFEQIAVERVPRASKDSAIQVFFDAKRQGPEYGPLGGIEATEVLFGEDVRLEYGGSNGVSVAEQGIHFSVFPLGKNIPHPPQEVTLRRLKHAPAWKPPPPLLAGFDPVRGGLQVRVENWSKDSIRFRVAESGWRSVGYETMVTLKPGTTLQAYASREGISSDTVSWTATKHLFR